MEGIIAHIVAGMIYAEVLFTVASICAALVWVAVEIFREAK